MKVRNGFVSNSSSSSFIVGATEKEILEMKGMFGHWCDEEDFIPNFSPEDSEITDWIEDDEMDRFKEHVGKIEDSHLTPVWIEVSYHNEELNDFIEDMPFKMFTWSG